VPTDLTNDDAARLGRCLKRSGVALIPTDTVYGLACDPGNESAARRLYALKGRPPDRPAAIMFFSLEGALEALPEFGHKEQGALRALLPGPVTVLLPNRLLRFPLAGARAKQDPASPGKAPVSAAATRVSLGLRVPLLPGNLAALTELEVPVMQSSANLSGGREARQLQEVPPDLRRGVDLELDGGALPGIASTVLDLSEYETAGQWRIAREGPLGREQIARALG
jgi:L-threonylcarbamoyladenylate synthase